jgi:hypothetical protein
VSLEASTVSVWRTKCAVNVTSWRALSTAADAPSAPPLPSLPSSSPLEAPLGSNCHSAESYASLDMARGGAAAGAGRTRLSCETTSKFLTTKPRILT